jgi:hypothetical protein
MLVFKLSGGRKRERVIEIEKNILGKRVREYERERE